MIKAENNNIKVTNSRKIALFALEKVKKGQTCANALKEVAEAGEISGRDTAFITDIVYGTVRNLIFIDYVINSFLDRPIDKLKPKLRIILELSVYQIFFMDSVPDRAAVYEGVSLAKVSGFFGLKGFVNAVLKNIAASKDKIVLPEKDREPSKYLSIKYSIPEFAVGLWLAERSFDEVEEMIIRLKRRPDMYVRTNNLKISDAFLRDRLISEGAEAEIVRPNVLRVKKAGNISQNKSFKEGLFYIQDISGICAFGEVSLKKGEKALDMCASPGGKTIDIYLNSSGADILSRDKSVEKVALIEENLHRLGINSGENKETGRVVTEIADATKFKPQDVKKYDLVVADVPCSGLGVISGKPDICLNITKERVEDLITLQRKILKNAVAYVKKGGKLIFSTCTINRAENEENKDFILRSDRNFKLLYEKQYLPTETLKADGFYICIFEARE